MKKAKGRIHPAPSADAAAALSLLPAAALAGLGAGDREVLAYLVVRAAAAAAAGLTTAAAGGPHGPAFGCGCFECYTSFWTRWDSSPEREAIHRAIEAFEEQLAASEKRRRRDRKGRRREEEERRRRAEDPEPVAPGEAADAAPDAAAEDERGAEGGEGERRRGWADVMGVLNWRLWSLWSPGDSSSLGTSLKEMGKL